LTKPNLYELWRLRLFSFGGYGLALAALALMVFGAIKCPPQLRALAFATFLVWWLRIGACGVGGCVFWQSKK